MSSFAAVGRDVGRRCDAFWILPYQGHIDAHNRRMPYIALVCKPVDTQDTWTVNGVDTLVVCCTDGWYVIPTSPRNRGIEDIDTRFDTVEEAVVYCNLMDNT